MTAIQETMESGLFQARRPNSATGASEQFQSPLTGRVVLPRSFDKHKSAQTFPAEEYLSQPFPLSGSTQDTAPPMWRAVDKLQVETSFPNWDYEQAAPIDLATWEKVRWLLATVGREPYVSASGDGYVHITWLRSRFRLVIEVGPGEWITVWPKNGEPKITSISLPQIVIPLRRLLDV